MLPQLRSDHSYYNINILSFLLTETPSGSSGDLYGADGYTVTKGVFNDATKTLVYKLGISADANRYFVLIIIQCTSKKFIYSIIYGRADRLLKSNKQEIHKVSFFNLRIMAVFLQTIELIIFSEDKTFTCEVLPAIAGAETQSITADVDVFSKLDR